MEIEKIQELINEIRELRIQLADHQMRINMLERLYANPENGLAMSVEAVASPQLDLKTDENQNVDVIDVFNSPASLPPVDDEAKPATKSSPPNLIDF